MSWVEEGRQYMLILSLLAEPCQRREEESLLLMCQETEQDETWTPSELHGAQLHLSSSAVLVQSSGELS